MLDVRGCDLSLDAARALLGAWPAEGRKKLFVALPRELTAEVQRSPLPNVAVGASLYLLEEYMVARELAVRLCMVHLPVLYEARMKDVQGMGTAAVGLMHELSMCVPGRAGAGPQRGRRVGGGLRSRWRSAGDAGGGAAEVRLRSRGYGALALLRAALA